MPRSSAGSRASVAAPSATSGEHGHHAVRDAAAPAGEEDQHVLALKLDPAALLAGAGPRLRLLVAFVVRPVADEGIALVRAADGEGARAAEVPEHLELGVPLVPGVGE